MSQVKFLAGLKSDFSSKLGASGLIPGALYFCTDEKKIFKATANNAFEAVNEEVCYGELPAVENAFPGKLYLRQVDMTLHAVVVENGVNKSFKQLSAPANALVPNDISEDLNAEDNKKLASKAAVKAGIKAVADDLAAEIADRGTAEAQLLADAKKYADDQDAALKADLQKEIDDDVKVEKDRAELAEKGLADRLDIIEGEEAGSIKAAVKAEADRAKGEEARIEGLIGTEKSRAEAAELALGERIDALVGDGEGSIADQVGEVKDALEEFKNNVVGAPAEVNPENGTVTKEATGLFREIADEKAAREAEDAKLTKAIEDEVVRAKAAEEKNADAIADEASTREAKDNELQDAIDVINNAENGILAQAKALDKTDRDAQLLVDQEQDRRLKALEDANAEGGAVKEAIDQVQANLDAFEAEQATKEAAQDAEDARLDQAIKDEAAAARAAEKANADEMIKQKDAAQEGTLANQIKVEKEARIAADNGLDERLQAVEASVGDGGDLEKRVQANEDAIKVINGEGDGSIKKAVADLVDGAPQDLDTLKELSAALRDNKDVLNAIETAFDNKLKAVQDDVDQNEADCDAAIKAEKERAEGQEDAIRGEFAAADTKLKSDLQAEIDADVKVEKERAEATESKLTQDLAQEIQDRKDAVKGVQDQLDTLVGNGEGSVADQIKDVKTDLEGQLNTFKGEQAATDAAQDEALTDAIAEEVENRNAAIKAEADRAKEVEADFEARIAANEAFVAAQPAIDAEQDRRLKALEDANAEGGAMKEAVDAAQAAADAAQDAADAAQADVDAIEGRLDNEGGLVDRLEAAETFVAAQPAKDQAQDGKIADLEAFVENHDHKAMEDRIAANEAFVAAQPAVDKAQNDRIEALEGKFKGEESVDAKIAAAQAAAEAKAAELDGVLKTELQGYADQAEADAKAAAETKAKELDAALKTSLEGYADQAEADAKAHAEAYTNDALTWGSF